MARTLYATFATESDAERAAGALLDHGVDTRDLSFIVAERRHSNPIPSPHPDQVLYAGETTPLPPVTATMEPAEIPVGQDLPRIVPSDSAIPFAPPSATVPVMGHSPVEDVVVPDLNVPPVPELPQAMSGSVHSANEMPGQVAVRPGYTYDALGAEIPDPNYVPQAAPEAIGMVPVATRNAIASNTPIDTVEADGRHLVDNTRTLPEAARGISTTTAPDAAKGALEGAGLGVGLGILLGLATVAIPGIGLVAGAGALVAGLAAATGAAGGVAGAAYGFLNDMGLPPDTVTHFRNHLEGGGTILGISLIGTVPEGEALELLNKYHATSVQSF